MAGSVINERDNAQVKVNNVLYPVTHLFVVDGGEDAPKDFSFVIRGDSYRLVNIFSNYPYNGPRDDEQESFYTIDWGDGTLTNIVGNNSLNEDGWHEYESFDDWKITIKNYERGYLHFSTDEKLIKLLSPLPPQIGRKNFYDCFGECKNLQYIAPGLFDNCPDAECFQYCFALWYDWTDEAWFGNVPDDIPYITIPDKLFKKCPKAQDFMWCFQGAHINKLPDNLFEGCTSAISFYACFNCCLGLRGIPAGLFKDCVSVEKFDACFEGDISLSGTAPALWLSHEHASRRYCFYRCTNLTNYADIPADWK